MLKVLSVQHLNIPAVKIWIGNAIYYVLRYFDSYLHAISFETLTLGLYCSKQQNILGEMFGVREFQKQQYPA